MGSYQFELRCQREEDNPRDSYAVAVTKSRTGVVGHVPRYLSTVCSLFIRRSGAVYCIVTGTRRYSKDLPQSWHGNPMQISFCWQESGNFWPRGASFLRKYSRSATITQN